MTKHNISFVLAFAIFLFVGFSTPAEITAQMLLQPYNLNFESGVVGYEPDAWSLSNKASQNGYFAALTDTAAFSGQKCLKILSPMESAAAMTATVSQSVYAKPYLGKTVALSAMLRARTEMPVNYGMIYIMVKDKNGETIQSLNTDDSPSFSPEWEAKELVLQIDSAAITITYGFALKGIGDLFIDAVDFSLKTASPKFNSPPSAAKAEAMPYLVSFANIYGYVRHFYPSSYSSKTDWSRLAHLGVVLAEQSKSSAEFESNMLKLFKPIAPLLNLSGKPTTNFNYQKPKEKYPKALAVLHKGIATDFSTKISETKQVNVFQSLRSQAGLAIQANASEVQDYSGMKYEISIKGKIETKYNWSFANLLVRFENAAKQTIETATLKEPISRSDKMDIYKITGEIPKEAITIRIALNLYGEGAAIFDDLEMNIIEKDGSKIVVPIPNSEFESMRGDFFPGWILPEESRSAGYSISIKQEEGKTNKMLVISADEASRIKLPKEGDIFSEKLPYGGFISFPQVIFADSNGTLPPSDGIINLELSGKPQDFVPNYRDRESRLAIVIDLWNYVKNFYPFEMNNQRLVSILPEELQKVAIDTSNAAMLASLNHILPLMNDNHSRAWKENADLVYALPLLWKWIDGKLIVVKTKDGSGVFKGDEIIEINSMPVVKFLEKVEENISAANPNWKRLRALAEIRSGVYDSELTLKVSREGEKPRVLALKRNMFTDVLIEEKPERISMLTPDIVYCDVTRTTDVELKNYIKDIQKHKGIVFDTRGVSNVSEYLLGLLSDKDVRQGKFLIDYYAAPSKAMTTTIDLSNPIKKIMKLQHFKVAFVCDERSGGLSEVLLSVAKDNKIGKIFGRETAGNAGEVAAVNLIGGYNFALTVVRFVSPDGILINGKGILPDKDIKISLKEFTADSDPLIEEAVQYLNSIKE